MDEEIKYLDEEQIDIESVQTRLKISRELPIIDESRMKGIDLPKINEFLDKLSYIIFGERSYGVELGGFLSIYPLSKDKDFGERIRYLPNKIPKDYFPTVLIIDHRTCAKRDGRDSCLEEAVALFSVFPNGNGQRSLFKALRIHSEPAPKEVNLGTSYENENQKIFDFYRILKDAVCFRFLDA